MSTSRGTSLSRLLSNKELVTVRLSARSAALSLAAAAFLAGVLFGAYAVPELRRLGRELSQRRDHAAALAPLIEQAKLMPVTYELALPGNVVDWCVDHPSKGFSYLSGHQSQPLLWANEEEVPITYGTHSACQRMIARVVSREPQGLKLAFLGQP